MSTQVMNILNSANDRFKANYNRTMRWALLAAIVITLLFFLFSPQIEITPYKLRNKEIEVTDIQEAVEVPPPPQEVPKQVKQVEAVPDDEAFEEEEIADTLMDFEETITWGDDTADSYGGFEVSQEKPKLIKFVPPDYPEMARASQLEGTVVVKVQVGPDGNVIQAQVLQSVHPMLDAAAVDAARRAKFIPGKQRDIPVKAWMAIPYVFALHS